VSYPYPDTTRGWPPLHRSPAAGAEGDDETLLAQSLSAPERFGELYSRYFAEIYRYLAGRLGPDTADDLAAETFLSAFRRRNSFDAQLGAVRPWLYGFATNLVARHRRAESRRYAALARMGADVVADSDEEQIAERLTAWQARQRLAGALRQLSAGDRDVLLLIALGGLSYAEVAFALSVPEGTVASRLNRARRKLAAALRGTEPAAHSQTTGAAITAAAAVAVVTLWPATGTRPGAVSQATTPAAAGHHTAPVVDPAAVQRAILTAVTSAGGDILYISRSSQPSGPAGVVREWFWPSQPSPGQQVHLLIVQSAGLEAEITFTAAAGDQYTSGSTTGPAITGTEVIIDHRARTWSVSRGVTISPKLPEATSVAQLREDIAEDLWTVAGPVTLAGQAAIELVTTRPGPGGLTEHLWVNARTYLPLRQVKQNWNGPGSTLTYDFEYLRATAASRAELIPAVPAGYQQVPG
jgi:RNA polymerase sigma factor (sigma-70 family)